MPICQINVPQFDSRGDTAGAPDSERAPQRFYEKWVLIYHTWNRENFAMILQYRS